MRRRAGRSRLLLGVLGLAFVACAGAIAAVDGIKSRVTIVFDKATGRLNDIDWADLVWVLRPGSGVYAGQLAETRNPFEAIASPLRSKSDVDAGARLFGEHCSSCHGDGGHGGAGGPSLYERTFQGGRADWALFRTITHGIPGTAMVGRQLPRADVWRLVSYLGQVLATQNQNAASMAAARAPIQPVKPDELSAADDHPEEWLTYSGSYTSQRYSRLKQINRDDVGQLRVEWARQFSTTVDRVETSPIVRGSTMFVTEPPNRVHALDAASGRVLWTYTRKLPARLLLCCGSGNRGVALLGSRLYVGTLDAHLVALDANTGNVVWDVQVADYSKGFSITAAPLVIDDMVVTGIAGGEFGTRGFLDAYDAATGKQRWRFYTVPAPGEPGSETWQGDSLRTGGATTWLTGSFDRESRLIYWGTGNPSPDFYGENRQGDNLYSCSVIAIDADTGKLRWHFQFTPHDMHDWDSAQIPVLVDAKMGGAQRKLLAWANRNGFYYVLDRNTGEFLLGTPFAKQNWTDGLDVKGRPHIRAESAPRREGAIVYPSVGGATNWRSPTYDPEFDLIYVPTVERGSILYESADHVTDSEGQVLGGGYTGIPDEDALPIVKALEVTTGRVRWQYTRAPLPIHPEMAGLLSTAGRLVFGGDFDSFFALDAETGAELWHFATGGQLLAAPVSYQLDGRQYIAIAAGRSIMSFALPRQILPSQATTASH